ncbi:MAG: response regulator transcription factor, partial [Desulfobacterales bacterium]|nr:response regulator transcription factor [Desulfobacterales bacterium]
NAGSIFNSHGRIHQFWPDIWDIYYTCCLACFDLPVFNENCLCIIKMSSIILEKPLELEVILRILVVEDDETVRAYITKGLSEKGHTVEQAGSGSDGLFMATTEVFDAIILDRMLPAPDGMTVLKVLRTSGIETPVLILSALGEVDERVEGLKAGGDDYLTKPFALSELIARLEVIVKRSLPKQNHDTVLKSGGLEIDLLKHTVKKDGVTIELQPREFRLIEYLMRYKGQLVTRTMMLEQVWQYNFDPETNVVDVHISRIRNKIDPMDSGKSFIKTVRGSGYIFRES